MSRGCGPWRLFIHKRGGKNGEVYRSTYVESMSKVTGKGCDDNDNKMEDSDKVLLFTIPEVQSRIVPVRASTLDNCKMQCELFLSSYFLLCTT